MKIGSSLSRCVRDIYEGNVNKHDVLVIVTRTDFDPRSDKQWANLWNGYSGGNTMGSMYSQPEWASIPAEDEQKLRDIILGLYNSGKIHQPRQFGAHPQRLNEYWYDVILTPGELENNPSAASAWEDYKIAAKLGSANRDLGWALEDNF
jgi:hypothetical protein